MNYFYIRVHQKDVDIFENHLSRNGINDFSKLSTDMGEQGSSVMFGVRMDENQELNLRLSFELIGCLNFTRMLKKQSEDKIKL